MTAKDLAAMLWKFLPWEPRIFDDTMVIYVTPAKVMVTVQSCGCGTWIARTNCGYASAVLIGYAEEQAASLLGLEREAIAEARKIVAAADAGEGG